MQLSRLISGLVYGGSLGLMICLAGCQRSAGQQDGVSGAPAAPFIAGVSAGNDVRSDLCRDRPLGGLACGNAGDTQRSRLFLQASAVGHYQPGIFPEV